VIKPVFAIALGLAVVLLLSGVAELALRMGAPPAAWPTTWGPPDFDGTITDPLLGSRPRPGWSGSWFSMSDPEGFEVEIDPRGFRSTALGPAAASARRVAFLGDSCTFGWDVDSHETFAAQLARMAGTDASGLGMDVLNGGFPGDSAVVGLYKLREHVLPLAPDLVVIGFSANNAFRLTRSADTERFRLFALRKAVLRSRLVHDVSALLARWRLTGPRVDPRSRTAIEGIPLSQLHRVSNLAEFERALRQSVIEARAADARVLLLLLPRATEVSPGFRHEDVALAKPLERPERERPERERAGTLPTDRERSLLELSCLDPAADDALGALQRGLPKWKPLQPSKPGARAWLARGAVAYERSDYRLAATRFSRALEVEPEAPLALYALGAAEIAMESVASGLARMQRAEELACNVFLQYQVALWRIGVEMGVPVVDVLLVFHAHSREELFLDEAHPTARGHRLIAEALHRAIGGPHAIGRD
jgi:lysophospholipase L1-like esterase